MGYEFFTPEQTDVLVHNRSKDCNRCKLDRGKLHPRIKPYGNFRLGILDVGEAPGETEDRRGKPWQGKVGLTLKKGYSQFGIDLFEDCKNINSCACRPTDKEGNNRPPTDDEINCCQPRVLSAIEKYKPKLIMVLGGSALKSVIGSRWKRDLDTISKWRGFAIPDRKFGCWVFCTFHPSFNDRGDLEVETIWKRDLQRGLHLIDRPFPKFEDETKQIRIIDDAWTLRDKIRSPFAFDFETTGLKPYNREVHKIICASICWSKREAYVFMMTERNRKFMQWLLVQGQFKKMAHNLKFENQWSRIILGVRVRGWLWCSMIAAHVLDNRSFISSLKFQVYVKYGLADYDSEIEPFLKAKDSKNGNAVNRILELLKMPDGQKKLLIYCGLDSLFEYRLGIEQMEELGEQYV